MGDEEGDDGDEVEPERAAVTMPTYVSGAGSSISYNLKGPDLDGLTARAQDLQRLASELPGVAQIDIGARDDKPEIRILPDRAVLADAGLTPSAVGSLLRANIDGFEAASYKEDLKTVDIRVKLAEREGAAQIASTAVPAAPGLPVPLSALAEEVRAGQKVMIFRQDKERAVMLIGVVVNPAVLIVDAMSSLERRGEAPGEAVCHAVTQTFRAVLMVIVASGLGMLPIALSTGIGSVNRVGIGAASVGGILVAGALTFLVVPALVLATARRPRARGAEKR